MDLPSSPSNSLTKPTIEETFIFGDPADNIGDARNIDATNGKWHHETRQFSDMYILQSYLEKNINYELTQNLFVNSKEGLEASIKEFKAITFLTQEAETEQNRHEWIVAKLQRITKTLIISKNYRKLLEINQQLQENYQKFEQDREKILKQHKIVVEKCNNALQSKFEDQAVSIMSKKLRKNKIAELEGRLTKLERTTLLCGGVGFALGLLCYHYAQNHVRTIITWISQKNFSAIYYKLFSNKQLA